MDYLKEYIDALVAQQAAEDEKLAELVRARMDELLVQVQQPWRDAIRLRAQSEESRKELRSMLRRGDPAEVVAVQALRLITEMTGDTTLADQAERYLRGETGAPDDEKETEMLRQEYHHLVGRIEQMAIFLGDERIPKEERERAMAQFMVMDERSRVLRKLLDTREET